MDHRFPALRPQDPRTWRKAGSSNLPAPFDVTFLAALLIVLAIALA